MAAEEAPIAMVTLTNAADYRGEIRAGRFRLVADESPEVGGAGAGPSPYQLVLAGLAQCTAATLRMYAERKEWELGEIRVRVRMLRTGEGSDRVERIERAVTMAAGLSEEQLTRLAEIADRTPVTRTLLVGVGIDTTLGTRP